MVLIEQWKKSLKFLISKQFWLITLQTLRVYLPITIKKTGILGLIWFFGMLFCGPYCFIYLGSLGNRFGYSLLWLWEHGILVFYYLSLRSYNANMLTNKQKFLFIGIFLICSLVLQGPLRFLISFFSFSFNHHFLVYRDSISTIILLIFFEQYLYFFLVDQRINFIRKAFVNAARLSLYTFPATIILMVLLDIVYIYMVPAALLSLSIMRMVLNLFYKVFIITLAHTLYINKEINSIQLNINNK